MPTTGVKYLVAMLTFPGMYAAAGVYFASELEGQKDEAPKPSGKNDATRFKSSFSARTYEVLLRLQVGRCLSKLCCW